MEPSKDTKNTLAEELEKIKSETILSPQYKKRKALFWVIRTLIAIVLYILLWEYTWVRWTLVVYIPLSLVSLSSIFGWNFFLNQKIAKTQKKIQELEQLMDEVEEED